MILNNVKVVNTFLPVNIRLTADKISALSSSAIAAEKDSLQLNFHDAIVFPGLINSHDHLDFNLFPQLGDRVYQNYTQWGKHIHRKHRAEIAAIMKIPASLRSHWGIYKNLLCGVTTVVNHREKPAIKNNLLTVVENVNNLHSVQLDKRWPFRLNNPYKKKLPVAIHIGEGIDKASSKEIDRFTRWNFFKRRLIGIHAIAMTERQVKKFEAIVWCPVSNYFLFNKTARLNMLKNYTNILFGTDSTLTGGWDIWEHLRSARLTALLSDESLYQTLTQNAARTWQLDTGEIAIGKYADIVVATAQNGKTDYDTFFALGPASLLIVIHKGCIRLFDESLAAQLKHVDLTSFSKIYFKGSCKYVYGDLPGLMQQIRQYNPTINFPVNCSKPA